MSRVSCRRASQMSRVRTSRLPMSRTVWVSLAVILFALMGVLGAGFAAPKTYRIGVVQIVQHPALDAARDGFVAALKAAGYENGKNVRFDFQNAQGDMATAQAIARKFVDDRDDLILAIATPTAQACARVTDSIPILITAVTDPVSAGLVRDLKKPGTNVTGTSDLTPVANQLELLKKIVPKARRIGILYNAGESNSLVQVKLAEQAADKLGLTLVKASVAGSAEVLQSAQSLVGRVDAIYVPTDNTVVSAIESVIKVANANRLPLIAGEESCVRRGALATVGINYYELGVQTGRMAVRVLRGAKPAEYPIEYQKKVSRVINLSAAQAAGIEVPAGVLAGAEIIR